MLAAEAMAQTAPFSRFTCETGTFIDGIELSITPSSSLGDGGHYVGGAARRGISGNSATAVVVVAPNGTASFVIQSGQTVGAEDATFGAFVTNPIVDANGGVAFLAQLNFGDGRTNNQALIVGSAGGASALLWEGQSPAPGFGATSTVTDVSFVRLNAGGSVAARATVTESGQPNRTVIYMGGSGGVTPALITSTVYPELPPGVTFSGFFSQDPGFLLGQDDSLLVRATLFRTAGVTTASDDGIWLWKGGALTEVAREGQPVAGASGVWEATMGLASHTSEGALALTGRIGGNDMIFAGGVGALSLVMQKGASAPGVGAPFFGGRFGIAADGTGVLLGTLDTTAAGVDFDNNEGLWAWNGASLSLLIRKGQSVPGYPSATFFSFFPALGPAGELGFISENSGQGPGFNNPWNSIWKVESGGGLNLILAENRDRADFPNDGPQFLSTVDFPTYSFGASIPNGRDGQRSFLNGRQEVLTRIHSAFTPRCTAVLSTLDPFAPGSITGRVRFDIDGDGDPADADNGIPDLTVELFLDNGLGVSDGPAIAETTTASDGSGSFSFPSVNPGNYLIQVSSSEAMQTANHLWTLPEGLPAGVIALVTVEPGLAAPPVEILSTNPVEVNGIVKEDTNGDSLGDLPLSGVPVELVRVEDEQVVALVVTGENGIFHFPLVRPGLYALRETDLPNYISIEDSEGAATDNLVFISLTSGVTFPQQEFVDRNDSNFLVSLRGLDSYPDTRTVTQSSFSLGADDPGLPLILRPNHNLLDLTQIIAKGLIADGVTPLLIGLKSQIPLGEDRTLEWRVEVSGGDIAGGIYPKMQVWESGTFWRPAVVPTPETPNTITLTQGPADRSVFLQIEALQPWDLVFAGTTELRLNLSFFEIGGTVPVTSRTILIRRPPIGIIPDLGAGEIGTEFVGQLEHGRPPEFIIVLDSAEVGRQSFDRFRFDWSFVQGDIIGHGRGGILALLAHGQGVINFNRGEFRRMVGVGVPHNGSLLHTYLGLMEGRLRGLDFGSPALRYLPASISQAALWDDLRSQGDDAHALLTLDPLSPFFQEKPFASVPRSQASLTGFNPISVHHIATRIDPEQSPALRQIGLGHFTAHPSAATGLHKFIATSDGLIDLASQSAGIRNSGESDFLTPRPYNTRLSEMITDHPAHGAPANVFGGATTQLQSEEVARRSLEWLDTPLSNRADGIYRAPSPLSANVIDTIAVLISQRTFNDIIEIFSLPPPSGFKAGPLNQGAAPLGVTEYRYEIQPPVEAPATGSVNWFAEIHGPDGPGTLGVSVVPDTDDPLKVTVSVAEGLVGDVVVYVSYETTNDQIVYGRPDIVVSLPPDGETLTGIDLQPETLNLSIGRVIEPDIMAVYSQGTRIRRVVTPSDLGAVSSSAPAILDVSDPLNWRALAEGTATVTLTAFGFTDTATITVIDPFPRQSLAEWKADRYSPEDLLDPLISGNDVDRDGDGLDVLLEYLTGGDDRDTDFAFVPRLRVTEPSEPDPGRLVYTVRVSNTLEAVTDFELRSSLDLTQWTPWFDLLTDPIDLADPRIIDYRNFGTFTEVDFALPASGDPEFLHLEGNL